MNKIINILKPTGMTSHDVVSCVRRTLNMKKVGHTGTLDPDAAGVLPICLGRATKVSELILNKDKSYICELTLGIETDTYDSSGTILYRNDDLNIEESKIREAFKSQEGEIEQLPPVYSALKINGQKMCDLARKGKADSIDIKPRKVNIKKIDILNISQNKITFYVECSKGTYVRSICHDIGEYLNCGGHMSFLLRTSSGRFNLENSITLEELEPSAKKYYINGGAIDSRRFAIKKSKDNNNDDNLVRVYCEDIFVGVGKIIKDNNTMMLKSDKLFI